MIMCNKLSLKTLTTMALPFAFSLFLLSTGATPTKAAEEAVTTTSDTPAVTANHSGSSKSASHTSGHNGGNKSAVHASGTKSTTHASAARNGHAKPREAGAHQQKTSSHRKAPQQ
jgi:hypothetical protein